MTKLSLKASRHFAANSLASSSEEALFSWSGVIRSSCANASPAVHGGCGGINHGDRTECRRVAERVNFYGTTNDLMREEGGTVMPPT